MPINEADRGEFEAFRDLGRDDNGREILVGLSFEESEWYLDVLERYRSCKYVSEYEFDRKSELDDRHTKVRLAVIAAEYEAQDNLRRNRLRWTESYSESPAILTRARGERPTAAKAVSAEM